MFRSNFVSGLGRGDSARNLLSFVRTVVLGSFVLFASFVLAAVRPLPGSRATDWCRELFGTLVTGKEPQFGERENLKHLAGRARQLALQKNYRAALEILPEIDRRYAATHGAEYFLSLLALARGMDAAYAPDERDYDNLWAVRKVYWKIFLTPCSFPEDAAFVIGLKSMLASSGFSNSDARLLSDTNQFVALRRDAVTLLFTFEANLRTEIIPNYSPKPGQPPMACTTIFAGPPLPSTPAEIARRQKLDEESLRNTWANEVQTELHKALHELGHSSEYLVRYDFGCPPEDDPTASFILDRIPPLTKTKEALLAGLPKSRLKCIDYLDAMRRISQLSPDAQGSGGK